MLDPKPPGHDGRRFLVPGIGGNFGARRSDHPVMDCEPFRLAISARLDGEIAGLDAAIIDRHLAGCAGCRRYASGIVELNRAVRITAADPVPDLTPAILSGIGTLPRRSRWDPTALRGALAAVALMQLALGLPTLLLGRGPDTHLARELGSFDLALAVGFLFAAWRPLRAYGMLPLVTALVGFLALTSAVDLLSGRATATPEAAHLLELMGLAFVWLLARAVMPAGSGGGGGRLRLARG